MERVGGWMGVKFYEVRCALLVREVSSLCRQSLLREGHPVHGAHRYFNLMMSLLLCFRQATAFPKPMHKFSLGDIGGIFTWRRQATARQATAWHRIATLPQARKMSIVIERLDHSALIVKVIGTCACVATKI